MEIIPLGGLGEFGMNMMAIRHGGAIVVVDAGLMFPRDELLGVDIVVPELEYLLDHRDEVVAVVLTHGHEDHIGALPYILKELPVPVYATPLTIGFAQGRLREHDIRATFHSVHPREVIQLRDLRIEFLAVTHSIADSVGLAITTPIGTIVHTGDFKFDQTPPDERPSDYARFSQLGEEGVLALLSDSTNSERPGYTPSESHVRRHLEQIFHTARQRIVVACFASSIHRIQIALELAAEFGRRVVLVGRRMRENIAIARELGYLEVPDGVLASQNEAASLADHRTVLLCTGSQGEPMSGLARLALGTHKDYAVEPGDVIIVSARAIPGNERRISHVVNHFCRRGAKVYDEAHWAVHVSGHASQEELKMMLNLTRPRYFIPIHGEYRQLYSHTLLAREIGMPAENILLAETGDIVTLEAGRAWISGKAPVGRRLIDEGGLSEVDEFVVRDRQHLSEEGFLLAVVAINKSTGELEGAPELVSRGHLQEDGGAAVLAEARQVIVKTLQGCSTEERGDSVVLTEMIRTDLKRFLRKRTATRPMIIPVVLEI
jgi:ribonuclease J